MDEKEQKHKEVAERRLKPNATATMRKRQDIGRKPVF